MLRCKAESAKKKKKEDWSKPKIQTVSCHRKWKKKSIFNIFAGATTQKKKKKKKDCFTVWGKKAHAQAWVSACEQQQKKKTQRREKEKCNKKRKRVNTEISQSNVKKKEKKRNNPTLHARDEFDEVI